ncbi:hypothetical protein CDL12_23173 [Handroanthus impetiginosus]|uniref:Uncharacterized protein n=1 Tax=Handroanthus impetiginosus TaxID=429701 RepID=A0A2G9GG72_9LAMI|nr:hypothetical protein CDL12_23173 [Handroanthus impetiginosus]
MIQESGRKWLILVATTWIQAFTGTNLDFSSYSSDLKSVLRLSQTQLNYLSVASDMGKAFGWCSGVSLLYFPIWVVLFVAALMGFVGYGLQWLVIQNIITLPYFLVLLLSLLSGCSICWALALSLSISFNGVSAAIYNLIANSIDPNDNKLYLLLNAIIPLIISIVVSPPIIHHSPPSSTTDHDESNFLFLTALAIFTGLYLLVLNSISSNASIARLVLFGAMFLLVLPLAPSAMNDDLEVRTELMGSEMLMPDEFLDSDLNEEGFYNDGPILGEEHSTRLLVSKWDFWLYYVAYFCGGTLGLVYCNNLGQISESLGHHSDIGSLVSLYSACSFFGRLLSTAPDFLQGTINYARTGWLALALIPTPTAFLLLVSSNTKATLIAATALIGLSSGFVFSAAVSITSELFGPNRAGVNHNILITNIPLGSLLYSLLAALIYEANIENSNKVVSRDGSMVCIGTDCYHQTFVWWFCISLLGVISSLLLFRRSKGTSNRLDKQKHRTQTMLLKSFSSYYGN